MVQQLLGVPVVGDEAAPAHVEVVYHGQKPGHVLGGRALAHHHPHTRAELLQRLVWPDALVVAADSGRDISLQELTDDPRGVAVDRPARVLRRL